MIKEIRNNQDPKMIRIEYMPGNLCNHKCHYCFPGSNEGDAPWPDVELVKTNLSHLLRHYESQGKTKSNLYIVGGEPTLWKGLEDLCKHLKDNHDIIIEISTNGTRKINWWKENASNFDHVTVSVHREYANVEHLINVCDTLYEAGTFLNADVLMDPDAFNVCTQIVKDLHNSKHNWPIVAKVVHFNGAHRYTDLQLSYFDETIKRYPSIEWYTSTTKKPLTKIDIVKDNDEIITVDNDSWITRNKLNYFSGWECSLGLDILKIFPNGRITGNCQQKLYEDYNLYQSDFVKKFNPKISPVICTKYICGCNGEISANKRKLEDINKIN